MKKTIQSPSSFKLSFSGLSDIGLARTNNEDALLILEDQGFFALADGMGGHRAGEIAAMEVMRCLSASIEALFLSSNKNWAISELFSLNRSCIERANSWVHHLSCKRRAYQGMGTTLCTLLFYKRFLIYGHVGDSRIYRFRKGVLKQLTSDHSLHNQMIVRGDVKKGEARCSSYNNILTRAIGMQNVVNVDSHITSVVHDDIYLMCTDGLTNQVDDFEIEDICNSSYDLKTTSASLIKRANSEGGQDNVTVLMVKIEKT